MYQDRLHLKEYLGTRLRIKATVGEHSLHITKDDAVPSLILREVKEYHSDELLTDHFWLIQNTKMSKMSLQKGDKIEMNVYVAEYKKSNGQKSIGFIRPTGILKGA